MTFTASVNVIEHVGARPVLVDVEPDTPTSIPCWWPRAITPQTRAILPVHYAGHPAALDPITELARAAGLAVIEDAAHALPAKYRGRSHRRGTESRRLQLLRHQESDNRRSRDAHGRRRIPGAGSSREPPRR